MYVHVASCGRASEATRERVPAPRPLTAPYNATCRLGCVHDVVYGLLTQQRKATAGRRCGCWAPRDDAPPTHHDARLTPSPVGAWQRVHRKTTFCINNVRGEHSSSMAGPGNNPVQVFRT
jgi:hypothetical protein